MLLQSGNDFGVPSIAFFEGTVDVAAVKAVIGKKAGELGWNDVPRPRSQN